MTEKRIEIPKGIKPDEFFIDFIPKTYNKNVKDYDMSGYEGFSLIVQINITGEDGGTWAIKMNEGASVETFNGEVPNPAVTYTLSSKHFHDAVDGRFPWLPLEMAFDPEEFKDGFSPEQAHEEMDILGGLDGQADIRIVQESGEMVEGRLNFHGGTDPAVVFNTSQKIIEEIREREYTVMEAFMASKIRVDGPVEFAMHVMALAPEDEED